MASESNGWDFGGFFSLLKRMILITGCIFALWLAYSTVLKVHETHAIVLEFKKALCK